MNACAATAGGRRAWLLLLRCSALAAAAGVLLAALHWSLSWRPPSLTARDSAGVLQQQQQQQQQVQQEQQQGNTSRLKAGYRQWLAGFQAADPSYQPYCMAVLHNSTRFRSQGAQFSQDVVAFHNLFRHWPLQGRRGFYVEAGANEPLYLSTTLFFDKCLGWDGLCIEPHPRYHRRLERRRSCTLVPECISSSRGTRRLTKDAAGAAVTTTFNGSRPVRCAPLDDILRRYAPQGGGAAGGSVSTAGGATTGPATRIRRASSSSNSSTSLNTLKMPPPPTKPRHVDLFVLDVEGHELQALAGADLSRLGVGALLVEYLWLPPVPNELDAALTRAGYAKLAQLSHDSLFVQRGSPVLASAVPLWLPPQFEGDMATHREWMAHKGHRNRLSASWYPAAAVQHSTGKVSGPA